MLHCYSSGLFLCCRYFGSVEGSKFVEMAPGIRSGVTPHRDRWEGEGEECEEGGHISEKCACISS